MKNNLSDLNNNLFSMLELLENDEEMADSKKLDEAIKRSKAVCSVSTLWNGRNITVKFRKAASSHSKMATTETVASTTLCALLRQNMQS